MHVIHPALNRQKVQKKTWCGSTNLLQITITNLLTKARPMHNFISEVCFLFWCAEAKMIIQLLMQEDLSYLESRT